LLLDCLQAASRDDWSRVLGWLCQAACTASSSTSAAVFAWPHGSPKCLASFQVGGPSVEELARRMGKLARSTPAHQLGPYKIFPLLLAGLSDAGFLLESTVPLEAIERSIAAILDTIAMVVRRKLRAAEQQRAWRDNLSSAQSSRREMEHHDARTVRVRHDLNAPLVSMRGHLDMLLRGMAGPLSIQMRRHLRRLSKSVEHLRALIDSAFSAGLDGLELVDLNRLLRIALQRVTARTVARGIGLIVDASSEPVWARASRSALELLFRQLLRIAVRQSVGGWRIAARLRTSEEWLWIELRSEMPWQPQVGEFRVCQEIVRRHRGQLFVKEGRDVLVEIRLPRERDIKRWLQLGRLGRLIPPPTSEPARVGK